MIEIEGFDFGLDPKLYPGTIQNATIWLVSRYF